MLVLSGLNDRRVTYWEPLKWVARLRTTKTSDSQLLLSISPEDAHSGSSAFEANVRRQAETGAFLLLSFGIKK
ncbi:MAG: prolyl oligopeptidase family serine peptidase [Sphingomonadales bacterium]